MALLHDCAAHLRVAQQHAAECRGGTLGKPGEEEVGEAEQPQRERVSKGLSGQVVGLVGENLEVSLHTHYSRRDADKIRPGVDLVAVPAGAGEIWRE